MFSSVSYYESLFNSCQYLPGAHPGPMLHKFIGLIEVLTSLDRRKKGAGHCVYAISIKTKKDIDQFLHRLSSRYSQYLDAKTKQDEEVMNYFPKLLSKEVCNDFIKRMQLHFKEFVIV